MKEVNKEKVGNGATFMDNDGTEREVKQLLYAENIVLIVESKETPQVMVSRFAAPYKRIFFLE